MEENKKELFDEKLFIDENGNLTKLGLIMFIGCTIGCLHWLITNFKKNKEDE